MDKIIDKNLMDAFERYKKANGIHSDYALCQSLGINRSNYSLWKSGRSNCIRHKTWQKLSPLIDPFLRRIEGREVVPVSGIESGDIVYETALLQNEVKELREFAEIVPAEVLSLSPKQRIRLKDTIRGICSIADTRAVDTPSKSIPEPMQFEPQQIPYLNQAVSAGNGIEISQERYQERSDMFILSVNGESMNPTYKSGDQLIFQRFHERVVFDETYLDIEMIEKIIPKDSIIVYELNGGGLAMKRVRYKKRKKDWELILVADNKAWSSDHDYPYTLDIDDQMVIYGKVIGKV